MYYQTVCSAVFHYLVSPEYVMLSLCGESVVGSLPCTERPRLMVVHLDRPVPRHLNLRVHTAKSGTHITHTIHNGKIKFHLLLFLEVFMGLKAPVTGTKLLGIGCVTMTKAGCEHVIIEHLSRLMRCANALCYRDNETCLQDV